jgi:hypothetical protein
VRKRRAQDDPTVRTKAGFRKFRFGSKAGVQKLAGSGLSPKDSFAWGANRSRPVQAFPDGSPALFRNPIKWGVVGAHLRKQPQNARELRALTDPQAISHLIQRGHV